MSGDCHDTNSNPDGRFAQMAVRRTGSFTRTDAWAERAGDGSPRTGGTTMSGTPTFGRYAEIPIDQMTPEQRDGYRFLVDGPRGRLPGPYKVWVDNPKLVRAAAPPAGAGRFASSSAKTTFAMVPMPGRAPPRFCCDRRTGQLGLR